MRQKIFIPQCFSPFYYFFHFIVKKDTEWTLREKKKIKKNDLTSYPFFLLLFLLSSGVGTGDVTQHPAAKKFKCQTVPSQVQVWKYRGRGETKQVWETKEPSPPPQREDAVGAVLLATAAAIPSLLCQLFGWGRSGVRVPRRPAPRLSGPGDGGARGSGIASPPALPQEIKNRDGWSGFISGGQPFPGRLAPLGASGWAGR